MRQEAAKCPDVASLGALLRNLLMEMPGSFGDFARSFWLNGTARQRAAAQGQPARDVLPLPFHYLSVEELKQHCQHPAMREVLSKVEESQLTNQMWDWAYLSCLLANSLHAGPHAKVTPEVGQQKLTDV